MGASLFMIAVIAAILLLDSPRPALVQSQLLFSDTLVSSWFTKPFQRMLKTEV